jgi:hypothetical protein
MDFQCFEYHISVFEVISIWPISVEIMAFERERTSLKRAGLVIVSSVGRFIQSSCITPLYSAKSLVETVK